VRRLALRPKEAAKLLGVSKSHLLKQVREGRVRGIRFGKGRVLIPVSEIERLLGEPIPPEVLEALEKEPPAGQGEGE